MGDTGRSTRTIVGIAVVAAVLTTATIIGMLDLLEVPLFDHSPSIALAMAAVACASLTTTAVIALRAMSDDSTSSVSTAVTGLLVLGIGSIEVATRVAAGDTAHALTVTLGVIAWLGRGLLTFGLAGHDRGIDRVVATTTIAATTVGIVGTLQRPDNALPSDVEAIAATLLAATLVLIAIKWLRSTGDRPSLYGSVAFLACGLSFSFIFASTAAAPGDPRELSSLAWLILASALSAAWLDRRAAALRRERDAEAFEALRIAEEHRVLLESAELEHSVIRHDTRSSLTAVEGGVQALVSLHERGDSETLQRMSAAVLAELSRIRRLLDGKATETVSALGPVLAPLVALHRAGGLDVEIDLDDPELVLAIPPDHLAEAVENLLTNCESHAPGARVLISARTAVGGRRLLLTIHDSGPGVDPSIRDDIFSPYTSGGDSDGLGLHAVRSLIEASDGRVYLEPTFSGTSIRLDLPVHDDTVIDLRDQPDGQDALSDQRDPRP